MKRLLSILLCLMLMATFVACGNGGDANDAAADAPAEATADGEEAPDAPEVGDDEIITIRFATSLYVEEPHQIVKDMLVERYQELNPHIRIVMEGAEFANFWDNVTVEILAGAEADILQLDIGRLAGYHALREGGAFIPLDDKIAASGIDYYNLLVGQPECVVDGVTIALSCYAWGTTGIFYNRAILEEAGIDPQAILTTDDFVEALRATTHGDMVGMGVVVGAHSFTLSEYNRFFARGVTGGFYFVEEDAPFTPENLNVNSRENVEMARWWQSLILDEQVLRPGPDKRDARELFWNGLAAFNMDGPWFIGMTEARDPALMENLGLIAHPQISFEGNLYLPRPTFSPYPHAISTLSEHPEEAWAFLQWMATEEAQAIIALSGMVPCNRDFAESDAYREQFPLSAAFVDFLASYGPLLRDPPIAEFLEIQQIGNDAAEAMFSDLGEDPQVALDRARELMTEALLR